MTYSSNSNHAQGSELKVPEILVCDDDPDILKIVGHAINALGYIVIEATCGEEALEFCKKKLPDVVVMDIMMPGISGLDFIKWLRVEEQERFVPVLLLTALSEVDHRVEGLDAGADDYLPKPFQLRELIARVEALLRTKHLTERLHQRNEELKSLNQKLVETQETLLQKERELVAFQVAGAAAHNLRQPVTTLLLHCYIIEQACSKEGGKEKVIKESVKTIREECDFMNSVLAGLTNLDANQTKEYVGGVKIVDLPANKKCEE